MAAHKPVYLGYLAPPARTHPPRARTSLPHNGAAATYLSRWQALAKASTQARCSSRRRHGHPFPLHPARRRPSAGLAALLNCGQDQASVAHESRPGRRDSVMADYRGRCMVRAPEPVAGDRDPARL